MGRVGSWPSSGSVCRPIGCRGGRGLSKRGRPGRGWGGIPGLVHVGSSRHTLSVGQNGTQLLGHCWCGLGSRLMSWEEAEGLRLACVRGRGPGLAPALAHGTSLPLPPLKYMKKKC